MSRPAPVRVLLVEDDDDHAALVMHRLARSGAATFQVIRARSTAEARGLLRTEAPTDAAAGVTGGAPGTDGAHHEYDALVVDYRLGDGSGLELLAQLRTAGCATPAMLFTSHGSEHIAADAFRTGADDYLPKADGLAEGTLAYALLAMLERRRYSEALAHARERAARLDGALLVVRTVAHEINNALAPVVGFAELLALHPEVRGNGELARLTEHIAAGAQDVSERVHKLQGIVSLRQEVESPLGPGLTVLDLDRSEGSGAAREVS